MRPRHVEDLLAAVIGARCTPKPPDLGDELPMVTLQQTGGYRENAASYTHRVSFDVYAATWGEAYELANKLVEDVESTVELGGGPVYVSRCETLPYPNKDPRRDDLARYSFNAVLQVRGISKE